MAPFEQASAVKMNVLQDNASQNPQWEAQVDADTPVQPASDQNSDMSADQDCGSSDPPRPATQSSFDFPRIFKIPSIKETFRDVCGSCTPEEKAEAWSKTANIIKTYSDDMIGTWNSEIDTLLVYAGLFSAILTAFNVQSYQLLQPSAPDPTLAVLERISAQLGSFSVTTPFINSTQSAYTPATSASPGPTRAAVWLNILWFSGLICSLASASIGIMVKQWLREFSTGLASTSRDIAQLRQYRLNNLRKWKVAGIVSALPLLLQLSLILFLSGLLVLLWTLHAAVAAVSSALVGLLLGFMIVTIVLPILNMDCCYISPPVHAIYPSVVRIRRCLLVAARRTMRTVQSLLQTRKGKTYALLNRWSSRIGGALSEPSTWRIREVLRVMLQSPALSIDQIVLSYSLTLHSGDLAGHRGVCLLDTCCDTRLWNDRVIMRRFVEGIHKVDERHQVPIQIAAAFAASPVMEGHDLEVWLCVLLQLCLPAEPLTESALPQSVTFPSQSNVTRALQGLMGGFRQFGRQKCHLRPNALVRILKMTAPLVSIIMQNSHFYYVSRLALFLDGVLQQSEFMVTWDRAQYLAHVTEELLCLSDRTASDVSSLSSCRSLLMDILLACAELTDTPDTIATRLRLLALHEVMHFVHALHAALKGELSKPLDLICVSKLIIVLPQWHSIERRCRNPNEDEDDDRPWMLASDGQPLKELLSKWRYDSTDESRPAVQDEMIEFCERCIPGFLDATSCPICSGKGPVLLKRLAPTEGT